MRERIKQIMEAKGLKSSEFADKIDVTRGAISHILGENGRKNDPSKTTIDKILKTFPDISPVWFYTGEGSMLKQRPQSPMQRGLFDENKPVEPPVKSQVNENLQKTEVKTLEKEPDPPVIQDYNISTNISKKIDQIIIYFSDKTYMTFISKD